MRKVRNIFSKKASRVIRVLLVNGDKKWTIEELSAESKVSLGYTHAVISTLLEQDHVHRDNSYRIIISNPGTLIKRWASFNQYTSMNTFLRYHTFEGNIDKFLRKYGEEDKKRYAFTVLAGAHLAAPYVRPTNIHFYIKDRGDSNYFVTKLDLRPVETGGNVSMVLPYDEGVFYETQEIDGLNVVSNVQLYVDLLNFPARGEEAAERVISILEKEWKNHFFKI